MIFDVDAAVANGPDSFVWWEWVGRNVDVIWLRTVQHVQLTAVALGVGLAVSIGLAAIALRWRRTYGPITWFAGALYALPSVALFAFLVPLTGLGFITAEIGLVSYTLLILVRTIVTGIDGVDVDVIDAAASAGRRRSGQLLAVAIPIALPAVITGLRIAAVTIIGLVTVTALVGSGGYGVFILDGLDRNFTTPIVVGATLSIVLAVIVDATLLGLQRVVTPWDRRR